MYISKIKDIPTILRQILRIIQRNPSAAFAAGFNALHFVNNLLHIAVFIEFCTQTP